jgi:hypothetical protein
MIPLPEPVQVSELTLCAELLSTWIERHSVVALWVIGILALLGFCVVVLVTTERLAFLAYRLWQHARRRNNMKHLLSILLLLSCLALAGCADPAYWYQRTVWGIDCRPDHVQPNGQCTPVKKGSPDAQAARP